MNNGLLRFQDTLLKEVDKKATIEKASELSKQLELTLNIAKGAFDTHKQPMSVFYARNLLDEVKRIIRRIGDKDKELGEVLDFLLFKKNSHGKVTDISFWAEHGISERNFYRLREKALLAFAYEFNNGELLVFKE